MSDSPTHRPEPPSQGPSRGHCLVPGGPHMQVAEKSSCCSRQSPDFTSPRPGPVVPANGNGSPRSGHPTVSIRIDTTGHCGFSVQSSSVTGKICWDPISSLLPCLLLPPSPEPGPVPDLPEPLLGNQSTCLLIATTPFFIDRKTAIRLTKLFSQIMRKFLFSH